MDEEGVSSFMTCLEVNLLLFRCGGSFSDASSIAASTSSFEVDAFFLFSGKDGKEVLSSFSSYTLAFFSVFNVVLFLVLMEVYNTVESCQVAPPSHHISPWQSC